MLIRLVDPKTMTVVQTFANATDAFAARTDPSLIWCEADSDASAILQASDKLFAAASAQALTRQRTSDREAKIRSVLRSCLHCITIAEAAARIEGAAAVLQTLSDLRTDINQLLQ